MKTKAELAEYKGRPMVAIWEVDEEGKKVSNWPVISFGKRKAQAIIDHINTIKAFLADEKEGEQ